MSLLDPHEVGGDSETWTLADDPDEEAPTPWPDDQSDPPSPSL